MGWLDKYQSPQPNPTPHIPYPWQTSSLGKLLVVLALIGVAGLFVLKALVIPATPGIAVARAIRNTLGPEAGAVQVAGRNLFASDDGFTTPDIFLYCGTVGSSRRFAVLVSDDLERRRRSFAVEEIVIEPPSGRQSLVRERQLLDACMR